jgi:outer membrane protein
MKNISCWIWVLLLALGSRSLAGTGTNQVERLSLEQAHELALRNHPRIAAATYRMLAAEQAVKISRSGIYPSASLYATAAGAAERDARIMAGGLNNPTVFNRVAEGVGLTQLITDFGRTANLIDSSRFQAEAENQNAAATREQVLLQVDANYFGTLEAMAVLDVARQTFTTREVLVDQVSLLASNKLKSQLDVSFAQVALEEARLLVQKAQNNSEALRAALSTALGFREFHDFLPVEPSLPAVNETNNVSLLIEQALQSRPELRALRDQRDASLASARSQRDARLPTLMAAGAVGNSFLHDDRLPDNYAVGGIQLSLPLFAGGLYLGRQHQAELQAQAADELLQTLEHEVIRDVRIAWLNFNDAWERLRTTAQLLDHAGEAYDLAQARYRVGSSSIVELSQAQLEFTSAQIANTNARYDVLIQRANVDYQIGALR